MSPTSDCIDETQINSIVKLYWSFHGKTELMTCGGGHRNPRNSWMLGAVVMCLVISYITCDKQYMLLFNIHTSIYVLENESSLDIWYARNNKCNYHLECTILSGSSLVGHSMQCWSVLFWLWLVLYTNKLVMVSLKYQGQLILFSWLELLGW